MHSTDEAAIGVGAFVVLVVFLPWLRLGCRGACKSWVQGYSIQLNRHWGKPDRETLKHLKAKARVDALKSLRANGFELLRGTQEKMVASEKRGTKVVPPISTVWLAILVVFEAIQYLAIPFALGVKWNRDSMWGTVPKVVSFGAPKHDNPEIFEILIWVVLSPLCVTLGLALVVFLLFLLATTFWRLKCFIDGLPERIAVAAFATMKLGLYLLVVMRELLVEFGTLFIFAALLMVFTCSGANDTMTAMPKVHCWKAPVYLAYAPLAMLQLLLQFSLLFWNNLPLYTIPWLSQDKKVTRMKVGMNRFFDKDDYMLLTAELGSDELRLDAMAITGGIQVFDFDRPMFSSGWSCISGSIKMMLAAAYVFIGDRVRWQWALLSLCALAYCVLLIYNIRMAPCSFHWVNVSRTIGLVAGAWGTGCAFLAAGLGASSDTPTIVFVSIAPVFLVLTPVALCWARRSLNSEIELGALLKLSLMQNYEKLVAVCRMSRIVRIQVDIKKGLGTPIDANSIHCFVAARESLIRTYSQRLKLGMKEWCTWSRQGTGLFFDFLGGCCGWMEEASASEGEDIFANKPQVVSSKAPRKPPGKPHPDPQAMVSSKVESWMASATFVVDPSEDEELGLSVPLDAYFTVEDGIPRYTVGEESTSGGSRIPGGHQHRDSLFTGCSSGTSAQDNITTTGYLTLEVQDENQIANRQNRNSRDRLRINGVVDLDLHRGTPSSR